MTKQELEQAIWQLKYFLREYFIEKHKIPLQKEDFIIKWNEQIWQIMYDFVANDLWYSKYLEILYDIVIDYLKRKKTKWAKILLFDIEHIDKKDWIIELWGKKLNWGLSEKEKEEIENRLYKMVDKLTATMLRNHSEWTEKVESAFYDLAYMVYPI